MSPTKEVLRDTKTERKYFMEMNEKIKFNN